MEDWKKINKKLKKVTKKIYIYIKYLKLKKKSYSCTRGRDGKVNQLKDVPYS